MLEKQKEWCQNKVEKGKKWKTVKSITRVKGLHALSLL